MSGEETPRNGVLAQCFDFFKDITGPTATGLQKFLVTVVILGGLVLLVAALCWFMYRVNVLGYWPWMAGVGVIFTGGMVTKKWRRARALAARTKPGQDPVGGEAGPEGDNAAHEDRDDVPDGAG